MYTENCNDLCRAACKEERNDNECKTAPPIGLTPMCIFYSKRLEDIDNAIMRYINNGIEIPMDWLLERNKIIVSKVCEKSVL